MKLRIHVNTPQPTIPPGSVVELTDERYGVVDCIAPSLFIGRDGKPEQIDRAYVIGLYGEFAAWVASNEIAYVYGEAESAAIIAALSA